MQINSSLTPSTAFALFHIIFLVVFVSFCYHKRQRFNSLSLFNFSTDKHLRASRGKLVSRELSGLLKFLLQLVFIYKGSLKIYVARVFFYHFGLENWKHNKRGIFHKKREKLSCRVEGMRMIFITPTLCFHIPVPWRKRRKVHFPAKFNILIFHVSCAGDVWRNMCLCAFSNTEQNSIRITSQWKFPFQFRVIIISLLFGSRVQSC